MFLALTEGDNRNVMAAQLAIEALGARQCVAKINDPVRAEAYAHLGHRGAVPDQPDDRRRSSATWARPSPEQPGIYAPEHPHLHRSRPTGRSRGVRDRATATEA